jgi:hypothetical protein
MEETANIDWAIKTANNQKIGKKEVCVGRALIKASIKAIILNGPFNDSKLF